MRGASWLPLAAAALVSNAIDARAQAVNLGGVQPRPQARIRSFDNMVPAGVQRQSPGNNIVTDGQTATNVRVHGSTTTITTSTISGGNAFNSFKTFSEAQGNTVNLVVPDAAGKLVNVVREGPVNIQGVLNSYQNGKIGGKVVFADSYGFVVGASGSINVGGLTVVTPTKATIDRMISGGAVNNALVARVVTGDVPLSPDGSVVINGRVNATQFVKITATDVRVAGSLQAARAAAEQKAQFAATVNTRGWGGGGTLVAHNGSISISGANSVAIDGSVRAGSARHPGAISVASGKSVRVTGKLEVEGGAGRNGGNIDVSSGGDITIAGTAKLSVAGIGQNSNAGAISVKAGSNLSVEDGASFNAHGGTSGNGGSVELSAHNLETLGRITVDLGATAGKAGSLLLDPADLVIGAVDHGYASYAPNITTNGGSVNLLADNSITVAADGIIDTRSASGSGSVNLTAPHINLIGGSQILASSVGGGAAGNIVLTSVAGAAGDASILIGDTSGLRTTIAGQDLIFHVTANAGGSTAHAVVLMKNADVTAAGRLEVSALAGVNKSVNSVGAVATTDVLAAVDILDGAKLVIGGTASLQATASTTINATAAPNALSSLVADASAAVVNAGSTARVHIGGTADVHVTGALGLTSNNTVSSTSRADASGSSAAGASVAVNILDVETSALIDGTAKIASGPLSLAATSNVAVSTAAKAAAQGAGEAGSGSTAGHYLSNAKYAPYESTSDGGVKAAGALAIADVTSNTLAQMSSSVKAVVTGATSVSSTTGNSSSVMADGSSASGSTGVGVAVGVGLSHISNKSLLQQQIETSGLTLSATMTGTAVDNSFAVSATSGAAGSNVGVAGALATNLLDSESIARFGSPLAILSGGAVSLTAADLSTATALATPAGSGASGGKVGVGASVALNLVATRATAELADGSSLAGA
ncbi:leukotoxin LktA family filamentous adhesin, partial [Bradyrhizobium campsiandrae]